MSSHDSALQNLARKRATAAAARGDADAEMALHLMSVLNKFGIYTKESDPEFKASPAAKLTKGDVTLLQELPGIIAGVKRQKGPPGDPGKPGAKGDPGRDAIVNEADIVRRVIRKIRIPKDGEPGKDAIVNVEDLVARVLKKMPKLKAGESMSEAQFRDLFFRHLPPLPQDLSKSARPEFRTIRGATLDGLQVVVTNEDKELVTVGVSVQELLDAIAGGGAGSIVDNEIPNGLINDSNVTYELAHTPTDGTLHLLKNGIEIYEGEDFTITGSTLTLSIPLAAAVGSDPADKLRATYRY